MPTRVLLFTLSLMFSWTLSAQKKDILAETQQIAESEMKASLLTLQATMAGNNFSKASANFDVHYLNCKWKVDPAVRYIQGSVLTGFTMLQRSNIVTLDLMDDLKVDSVTNGNVKLNFYRPFDNTIVVSLGSFLDPGQKSSFEVHYKGVPPPSAPFSSFTNSSHAGVPVMWTLSEPYGGRDWWPCKNGLNDKADSIDISITTPQQYTSSTNGLLINESVQGGFRTTQWKHRYPIATYLVAFAATNYTILNSSVQLGNVNMPIMEHAYPEKVTEMTNAAALTARTLQLLHNSFTPYPFINERYGHTHWGFGGGMEHQTNSFMVNMSETLLVHEAAHQWFGDKITCGTWRDIWLNEGYAVFCVNYNVEKHYPENTLLNLYRSQINNITSKPNGVVYVDDTTNAARIFDSRLTYNKGGWVLQMLRWKLGDSTFFRATRNYLNDPALRYNYARTEDLKKHFERESGTNLTEFFKDWVYGQGFPSYKLQWAAAGGAWVQTTLSQTTSDTSVKFFEMPVPIRFKNSTRDTIIVLNHTRNAQMDFFRLGFIPDSAFIDPKLKLISANNAVVKAELFPNAGNAAVFPNPIGDQFSVLLKGMGEGELHLSVYNSTGALVWRRRYGNFKGDELFVIPTIPWPHGSYWLKINKDDAAPIVRRLMK
jgi:aminopeptidase N